MLRRGKPKLMGYCCSAGVVPALIMAKGHQIKGRPDPSPRPRKLLCLNKNKTRTDVGVLAGVSSGKWSPVPRHDYKSEMEARFRFCSK